MTAWQRRHDPPLRKTFQIAPAVGPGRAGNHSRPVGGPAVPGHGGPARWLRRLWHRRL